jgi:uncharacterized protein YpmB
MKQFKFLAVIFLAVLSLLMVGCNDNGKSITDDNSSVVQPGEPDKPENPENPTPTPAPIPIPTPVGEWQTNVSVTIASASLKNDSATFGQKERAKKGIERTDLKAMPAPNWGQNTLEAIFEMDGREFNTVFQNVSQDEVQTADLIIRTNKEGREVVVSFNGISKLSSYVDETGRRLYTPQTPESQHRLLEYMKLVDTVANVEIPFIKDGKLQSYSFVMGENEKERKFTIVLGTEKVKIEDLSISSAAMESLKKRVEKEEKPEIDLDAPLNNP